MQTFWGMRIPPPALITVDTMVAINHYQDIREELLRYELLELWWRLGEGRCLGYLLSFTGVVLSTIDSIVQLVFDDGDANPSRLS